MKRIIVIFIAVLSLLQIAELNAQSRVRKNFNAAWKFKLDSVSKYDQPIANDAAWRVLDLPHDWSIEGAFSEKHPATYGGGALPGGIGWYRKSFTISNADKNKLVFIEFDGVYRNSEVWINGYYLGKKANGYISFEYELSRYLNYGTKPNVISVRVDNSLQPNSRWYSGSGIYRNVWLTTVDRLHIDQWGTFATTVNISNDSAQLNVETKIRNDNENNKKIKLSTEVFDGNGERVAETSQELNAILGVAVTQVQSLKIAKPHLWSVDDPFQYRIESKVFYEGRETDSYTTMMGIRQFDFDIEKGFILNGKPLKIRGVCNHHDLGALGAAINTRAIQRQLEILKAMGCNGIRTSHNPPAPELLELCDKMGFIVMDEAFDIWKKGKNPYDYHLDWDANHYQDLVDQIRRDRNHPSVFIWSVGNEVSEQWGDTSGRIIARELAAIVKSWDPTRPFVTANNNIGSNNNVIQSGAYQLVGYNYNHNSWAQFPASWPGKSLIVTESVSALETRGHYDKVPVDTIRRWPVRWDIPFVTGNKDLTVSAYDNVSAPWGSTHEETLKVLEKYDHVSGMYVWTGFDYLGEPTPYVWPARSSYFGIIDLAGFPKDVYYLYQSVWTNKPVLHLLPHWNWNTGDTIDVVGYYNQADEVELFLNGASVGIRSKKNDNLHVQWKLPFKPGTLKAVSRKDGKQVLATEIKTAGVAARIIMKADRSEIAADGKDLSFITVSVVDKDGVLVPGAENIIQYSLTGGAEIVGLDNGSPTSHESFKGKQHSVMNGLGLVMLQSKLTKGKVILRASSKELQAASVEIEIK